VVERRQASAPDSGRAAQAALSVARPARRLRAGHETLRLPAFRFPSFSFVLSYFVIAGLDPAIHAARKLPLSFRKLQFSMDRRVIGERSYARW
jgi:hypothetical protein